MDKPTNEHIVQIVGALITNSNIVGLDIDCSKLNATGVNAITQLVKCNNWLQELCLKDLDVVIYRNFELENINAISELFEAMKYNKAILRLGIRGQSLRDLLVVPIFKMMIVNDTVIELGITWNDDKEEYQEAFRNMLRENKTLRKLKIDSNGDLGSARNHITRRIHALIPQIFPGILEALNINGSLEFIEYTELVPMHPNAIYNVLNRNRHNARLREMTLEERCKAISIIPKYHIK